MISHKHKCIFVHIPKCGGQSVESVFVRDYGIKNRKTRECYDKLNIDPWYPNMSDVPKEMLTSHWLLSDYPENLTQNYFTFALVRHPMERAISFFKWHKKYKDISFETFCLGLFSKNKWEFMMTRPQVDYLEGGVDKLVKLGDHYNFFKERFGFTLPHINKSENRQFEITPTCESIIRDKYREDFELWENV